MTAVNDLYLANWYANRYEPANEEQIPRMERHLRIGANQYFMRLMCGHLYEAVGLVAEFNRQPALMEFLKRSPSQCKEYHDAISACLVGGKDNDYFERVVGRLRDKAAFHYDLDNTKFALKRLARAKKPFPAMITFGSDLFLTRFNLADVVMDVVLTRKILRIVPPEDVVEGLRPFADFLNEKALSFVMFVKIFTSVYLER